MAIQSNKLFRASGQVIDRKTAQGVGDLRVEAWDGDLIVDDFVGKAITDAKGRFSIAFDSSYFADLFLDRQPDLFFKVFNGDELITSTEDSVLWNVRAKETEVVIEVDRPVVAKPAEPRRVVQGQVTLSDGSPYVAGMVNAFDKDLRTRQPLGTTRTDGKGAYKIEYTDEQFARAEKGSADLVVEVYRQGKIGDELLVASNVWFNAPPVATVNLTVPNDKIRVPSELDLYLTGIAPLLEGARVFLPDLNDDDVAFIAGETGIAAQRVTFIVKAAQRAGETKVALEIFYAFSRKGLPGDLPALLDVPAAQRAAALDAALAENLIPLLIADEKVAALAALEKLHEEKRIEQTFDTSLPGRQLKVRQLLALAGLEEAPQRALASAMAGRDWRNPNLWSDLQADTGLSAALVDRVQWTVATAEIADDHLATVSVLTEDERAKSVRDLAKLYDPNAWQTLITKTTQADGSDLPGDLTGKTPDERRADFAKRIYTRVATAYPTVALAYGLSRQPALADNLATQWLPRILDAHEDFDLATAKLHALIPDKGNKLGIAESEVKVVREDLKRVQRLFRLKPDLPIVGRLLEDKLDSAAAIVQGGRTLFLAKYGKDDAIGKETAAALFRQAEIIATKALGLYGRNMPTISVPVQRGPLVPTNCAAELKGVPDYATLFGSLDGCECEPCESVYSPAAYLTDLLAFLGREIGRTDSADQKLVPANGLKALLSRFFCDRDNVSWQQVRRPDILDLQLSCRNAETPMPYVDLVLEILESAPAGHAYQTGLNEEQLAAQPEHQKDAAYKLLAGSIFPVSMPFDLWQEEETIYFEKLGTSRAELLKALFLFVPGDPHDLTEIRRWTDKGIAAAHLGLTDLVWQLISGTLPSSGSDAHTVAECWGYASSVGPDWWKPLANADKLLECSGLNFDDLLRLLGLRSFNPKGNIEINSADDNKCDAKEIGLSGLDETALEFLHRFLRLRRALGWSLRELDQALMGLAPPSAVGARPALNEHFLVRLSHLIHLRQKFNLPLAEILAWWSKIDTADYTEAKLPHQPLYRSPYEALFQPGSPGNLQFEAFNLNAARTELNASSMDLTEQLPAIAGALGLSQPEVDSLIQNTVNDPKLVNLENLSTLYRHASLARALGLKIEAYLTLKCLLKKPDNLDPFIPITLHFPAQAPEILDGTLQTLRFVDRAEAVRDSGFSIAELDYLLRQTMPFEGNTVAPTDEWVTAGLKKLRESQAPKSVLDAPLALLKLALEKLEAAPTPTVDELRSLITEVMTSVDPKGSTDQQLRTTLQDALALVVSPGIPLDLNALKLKLISAQDEFELIRRKVKSQALATALAEVLGLSVPVCEILLARIPLPAIPVTSAGDAFLAAFELAEDDSSAKPLPELLRRLHKASLVIGKLAISSSDLASFMTLAATAGWLDLASLPVRAEDSSVSPIRPSDPAVSFDAWARSVRLFQFRDTLPDDQQEQLFKLFEASDSLAYSKSLESLTHWDVKDMGVLIAPEGVGGGILNPKFPDHFRDERLLVRLAAIVQLLHRDGTTAEEIGHWIGQSPGQDRVNAIKNTLTARYGESWPEVLKPLRDPLREQQRQALVTYLLHDPEWNLAEPADLYDHFLIDVEMSPCMMTSRLIQATSSVQLFVQRVMMNLEPGLTLSDEAAEQWEWMKNYRVWEANRKIFLYPENWIEPELRDDKTPFFKDLENELRQADITNESAEAALRNYVEKLDEVAHLQVCGMYIEPVESASPNAPGILHVLARTRSTPNVYYYRQRDADRLWSVWERVDAELEGDQLIPVYFNRRLYVFWPILTEKDEKPFDDFQAKLASGIGTVIQSFSGAILGAIGIGQLALSAVKDSMKWAIEVLLKQIINPIINGPFLESINGQHSQVIIWDDEKLKFDDKRVADVASSAATAFSFAIEYTFANFPKIGKTDDSGNRNLEPSDLKEMIEPTLRKLADGAEKIAGQVAAVLLPAKSWEIQMAWSERRNGTWTAKKLSPQSLHYRDVSGFFLNKKRMFFYKGVVRPAEPVRYNLGESAGEIAQELQVECYWQAPSLPDLPPEIRLPDGWLESLKVNPFQIGAFVVNERTNSLDARPAPPPQPDNPLQNLSQILGDVASSVVSQLRALTEGEPVSSFDDSQSPIRRRLEGNSEETKWLKAPEPRPNSGSQVELVPLPKGLNIRLLASHQFFDAHPLAGETNASEISPYVGPINWWQPFFLSSCQRQFTVEPKVMTLKPIGVGNKGQGIGRYPISRFSWLRFKTFYHPFTSDLRSVLIRKGIPGLYHPELQTASRLIVGDYQVGNPISRVDWLNFPAERFEFENEGAYAQYNWEIFFHAPLLIATRLSTNQKFQEAQHWFHYIFNPTDASANAAPAKFWRTLPFANTFAADYSGQAIDQLMSMLNAEADTPELQDTEKAVQRWQRDAFNPHLVARTRTTAFQKTVVMKYIDNLVAWGDSLFRRETREAVSEATQLYLLAAKLLGPRPRRIPRLTRRDEKSFRQLNESGLDAFSNALVDYENYLPASGPALPVGAIAVSSYVAELYGQLDRAVLAPVNLARRSLLHSPSLQDAAKTQTGGKSLYFCVPPNSDFLEYWDRVADRLFKIRHCQNIDGQAMQLSLLSPSIDPAILVRAKAMGVDFNTVLGDLYAPLPHYRFQVLAQKATELCGEVKSLGAALLSALEKSDGEALALLRNTQENRLLEAVQTIKEYQIVEASRGLEGLQKSHEATTLRRDHNQRLLMEFVSPEEVASLGLSAASMLLQFAQIGAKSGSAAGSLVPNIKGGFVTTLGAMFGGHQIGDAGERVSDVFGHLAGILSSVGGMVSTMGGYRRRAEDWGLQVALASKELEGLEKQIAAAEIRVAVAESDLENHKLQIRHSKETKDFMQKKYTSQELYDWMVSQISTLYFQTYQLAYDLAKKCERSFAHELGVDSPGLIRPGYWDNLKKGLLAGEQLNQDIKRLEVAYLNQNKREFELTKHISLALLDPTALVILRETGRCIFNLPEEIFDLDYPGHYFRRIKSVSLTLPCVAGPYTTISCTLRLVKNSFRRNVDNPSNYRLTDASGLPVPDDRFSESAISVKAIAASSAQNDSGVFELGFRDERYLPFEGAGVISTWSLELFTDPANKEFGKSLRQFDYSTISDAILHLKYTAREDVGALKNAAIGNLRKYFTQPGVKKYSDQECLSPSLLMLDLRRDFASQWSRFINPTDVSNGNVFELETSSALFPVRDAAKTLKINEIFLLARCTQQGQYKVTLSPPLPVPPFSVPPSTANTFTLAIDNKYGLHKGGIASAGVTVVPTNPPVTWKIALASPTGGNLTKDPAEVMDAILLLGYEWAD